MVNQGASAPAGEAAGGGQAFAGGRGDGERGEAFAAAVSYTHLRAHETVLELVCRLLLEKKKKKEEETAY